MAKKRKGDGQKTTETNPKPRINATLPPEYHAGLEALARANQRSNAGQIENIIITAVDAAVEAGDIPPLMASVDSEKSDNPMTGAIAICQAYADTSNGAVATAFIIRTASTLGVDPQELIKRCTEAGIKPKRNGNGTSVKTEVKV